MDHVLFTRAAVANPVFARLNRACAAQKRQEAAFDPPLKRIARLEAVAPIFMGLARQAIRQANADREAKQIERAKQVAASDAARKTDKGTLVRRQRGELIQEDRPDIDSDAEYKPTLRGARRRDPLREFLGIKHVNRPHEGAPPDSARRWVAAQAYRAVLEIAAGAKVGDKPMERVDATASAGGYSDRMLDAISTARRVKVALGGVYPLIRWTVEEYGAVDEFAVIAGISVRDAEANLTAGLDALVDHLGGYEPASQED